MKPRSSAVARNEERGVDMGPSFNIGTGVGPQHTPIMRRSIGLMSGTSLDGIDVAMIETDGRNRVIAGPALTLAYPPEFRKKLRSVLGGVGAVAEVEDELNRLHAEAVEQLLGRYSGT